MHGGSRMDGENRGLAYMVPKEIQCDTLLLDSVKACSVWGLGGGRKKEEKRRVRLRRKS